MKTLRVLILLAMLANLFSFHRPARAAETVPAVWNIVSDDFEGGSLAEWGQSGQVALAPGGGINGSTGLAVTVGKDDSSIRRTGVAKAVEGYLSFWFNPNGVSLPEPTPNYYPPGTSLAIAEVLNSSKWWPPLVALYLRKPPGEGYKGYLAWPNNEDGDRTYDYEHAFTLGDGWQQITVGYRIDEWVAVWVNGSLIRKVTTGIVHADPYGDIVYFGKIRENSSTPGGTIRFDNVAFQVPRVDDLWVDAERGSDQNDGLTASSAYRTIQKAADIAGPGTTVHILPGVYRETVRPVLNGTAAEAVVYRAENGPGTVTVRGSEPSSSLAWTQLSANTIGLPAGVDPANIYTADLSSWGMSGSPRFVIQFAAAGMGEGSGPGTRLPLAREPDWGVTHEWKTHEFWWAADGGAAPAACDPATDSDHNCDLPQRSMTQLTDRNNDSAPTGVEPGNLATLGDLTGARLIAIDTFQGHYVYSRTITAHDVGSGRITVNAICEHDGGSGNPGLGWGTKYFVENKASLLDTPGEWWYDTPNKRLYLWPATPGNPGAQNIEISRRGDGIDLQNRSYVTLDGLTVEIVNRRGVTLHNWTEHKSYGNTLRNLLVQYANYGVYVEQNVAAGEPAGNVIDSFTLENSEVAYTDSQGMRLLDWWENGPAADAFVHPGIRNTLIRGNEFHHLGFRTDGDNAVGLSFGFANQLRFENNHVHHIGHNGVQFSRSVIQSEKTYGFDASEIKTGEILIKDNLFEKSCQLTTDCGELKFWGSPPDHHVFRDVLVIGNIFRDTIGWSYVSEKRQRYTGGEGSEIRGMGAYGLFVDHASGIHAYRNIAYNNAYLGYTLYGVWRDGLMIYTNNVAANSLYGISLGGGQYDTHGSVDTQIYNNILINNEAFGLSVGLVAGRSANTFIDNNLYYNNGWRTYENGGIWHAGAMVVTEYNEAHSSSSWKPYASLPEAQAATPWEDHGVNGDPSVWDYDLADHNLFDGSWPDFHLTPASTSAIDAGLSSLPASLTALLDRFGIADYRSGSAYDIGRYEAGYTLQASPFAQAIRPGETATYTLKTFPTDLPYPVVLSVAGPSSHLTVTLSSDTLVPGGSVTLHASHDGTPETRACTLQVNANGGGFSQNVALQLLIGGERIYLPVVSRESQKPSPAKLP
ncbi:MAG: right-handed parallel beta-helix repeat-containing protein [Chloroflexota bacterium]